MITGGMYTLMFWILFNQQSGEYKWYNALFAVIASVVMCALDRWIA